MDKKTRKAYEDRKAAGKLTDEDEDVEGEGQEYQFSCDEPCMSAAAPSEGKRKMYHVSHERSRFWCGLN